MKAWSLRSRSYKLIEFTSSSGVAITVCEGVIEELSQYLFHDHMAESAVGLCLYVLRSEKHVKINIQ